MNVLERINPNHFSIIEGEVDKEYRQRFNQSTEVIVFVNKENNSFAKFNYENKDILLVALEDDDAFIFLNSMENKNEWTALKLKDKVKEKLLETFKEVAICRGKNRAILSKHNNKGNVIWKI